MGMRALLAVSLALALDFYAGKTINIYIGTGEGAGALSAYPRAMAQVIGKYIPGNPALVVRYMPGAAASRRAISATALRRRTARPGASSPAALCAHRCSEPRRRSSIRPNTNGSARPR